MPERVLVAYATHKGSTGEVAECVGETIRARGFNVEVAAIEHDPSPDGCAAVVVGSAVNGGQWLPEAVAYVRRHRQTLNSVPVAVFTVHIMNSDDNERSRRTRRAYLDSVRALIQPVDEAFFLGIGPDPAKDSWLARWLFRRFGGAGEGDCRDWEQIRGWASQVLPDLPPRSIATAVLEPVA